RLCVHRARGGGGAADAGKEGCRLRQGGALPDARARGVDLGRGRAGSQGGRDAGGGRSDEDGERFARGERWRGESNKGYAWRVTRRRLHENGWMSRRVHMLI